MWKNNAIKPGFNRSNMHMVCFDKEPVFFPARMKNFFFIVTTRESTYCLIDYGVETFQEADRIGKLNSNIECLLQTQLLLPISGKPLRSSPWWRKTAGCNWIVGTVTAISTLIVITSFSPHNPASCDCMSTYDSYTGCFIISSDAMQRPLNLCCSMTKVDWELLNIFAKSSIFLGSISATLALTV